MKSTQKQCYIPVFPALSVLIQGLLLILNKAAITINQQDTTDMTDMNELFYPIAKKKIYWLEVQQM